MIKLKTALVAAAFLLGAEGGAFAQSGGGSSGGGSSGAGSSGGSGSGAASPSRPVGNPTAPANRAGVPATPSDGVEPGSGRPGDREGGPSGSPENRADDPSLNQGIYRNPARPERSGETR